MSRRDMAAHQRRQRILAGLMYGSASEPTYERASKAAGSYLRGQGLRVSQEDLDEVAGMPVRDVLFPPCDCAIPLTQSLLPVNVEDRNTPGPHHNVHCPLWRAVRP